MTEPTRLSSTVTLKNQVKVIKRSAKTKSWIPNDVNHLRIPAGTPAGVCTRKLRNGRACSFSAWKPK